MIIAFTGHRPDEIGGYKLPNPTYNHVCSEIEKHLKELKPEKIISGMALGVDQWAAVIAYRLGIPYIAALPFEGHDSIWLEESKKIAKLIRKLASEEVIVSEGGFTAAKMQVRNIWMVDHCDKLIAVWNGEKSGGTYNCIQYAQSVNKEIIFIDPRG